MCKPSDDHHLVRSTEALKEAEIDNHTGEPEINLDLRELEKSIKNVKGVGAERAEEIMGIIEQWLGSGLSASGGYLPCHRAKSLRFQPLK